MALLHNRPVLGGNGSVEIGLRPRGITGPLIDEISQRHPNGDLYAENLLRAEPTASLFLEHTVYNTTTDAIHSGALSTVDNPTVSGSRILSVDARDARTGREIRLTATSFIDCSGKYILGLLSEAETLFNQKSKSKYSESLALIVGDDYIHHSNTLFFCTKIADSPISFPKLPWATKVAKDFSNLSSQLVKSRIENGLGPVVAPSNGNTDILVRGRMKEPLTHF